MLLSTLRSIASSTTPPGVRTAVGSPAHPRSPLKETAAGGFTASAAAKNVGEQRARRAFPAARSFPPLREVGGDDAGTHRHDVSAKGRGAGRQQANERSTCCPQGNRKESERAM